MMWHHLKEIDVSVTRIYFTLVIMAAFLVGCGSEPSKETKESLKDGIGGLISDINNEVVSEIRKKFPLPDPVVVNNGHNDVVNITTTLPLDKVVEFYRKAYSEKGFSEISDAAAVTSDSAKMVFRKSGEKDVSIEATKNDNETKVRLEKR
jgi:hypothetical protein